jgi:hypothetical protein
VGNLPKKDMRYPEQEVVMRLCPRNISLVVDRGIRLIAMYSIVSGKVGYSGDSS